MYRAVIDTEGIPASAPAGTWRYIYSPDLFNTATGDYPTKGVIPVTVTYPLTPEGKFYYWLRADSMDISRFWPTSDTVLLGGNTLINQASEAYSSSDKSISVEPVTSLESSTGAYSLTSPVIEYPEYDTLDVKGENFVDFTFGDAPNTKLKARIVIHAGWNTERIIWAWAESSMQTETPYIDFAYCGDILGFEYNTASATGYTTLANSGWSHPQDLPVCPTSHTSTDQGAITGPTPASTTDTRASSLGIWYLPDRINPRNFQVKVTTPCTARYFLAGTGDVIPTKYGYQAKGMTHTSVSLYAVCLDVWEPKLFWPTSDNQGAGVTYSDEDKALTYNYLSSATGSYTLNPGTNLTYTFTGTSSPTAALPDVLIVLDQPGGYLNVKVIRTDSSHYQDIQLNKILQHELLTVVLDQDIFNGVDPNNLTVTLSIAGASANIYAVCLQG